MSEDTKIFIVVGETGEYSDHNEWFVAAYEEKAAAEAHTDRAKQRADELLPKRLEIRRPDGPRNEHDPDMRIDYTGTEYYVTEVPFFRCDKIVVEEGG